jgi:hypothetical protein
MVFDDPYLHHPSGPLQRGWRGEATLESGGKEN